MSVIDFSQRLKELMLTEKISIRALSNKTNLQRKSIANWLNAKFYPRYDALIKLSNFFYVGSDYLVGRNDDAYKICNISAVRNLTLNVPARFTAILTDYLAKENITKYKLAKNLKIGQSTLSRWFDGKCMPETAVLIRLSDLMSESIDYLLGRE